MIAFANLHVLTVRGGEVYVHHFWLLVLLALWLFALASSRPRSGK
jgi:hypothetical protein